ncbi:ATP-grasp domain-containing protein [Micromonospora sp. URMC 103]|uniref:ATP-grasp domain-containing protein n=1 Tax=Micromonospora sp. URMC 103 TaxID=3423406 RepID=UPI003F1BBDE0
MKQPEVTLILGWRQELVEALLRRGVPVIVVLSDPDIRLQKPAGEVLTACRKVYRLATFNSLEEVGAVAVDIAISGVRVGCVVGVTEFDQYAAGYMEALLRGGVVDPLMRVALRDKRLMKARVHANGVRVAQWRSISDPGDMEQLRAVADELKFPIMVKPAAGLGTMSTVRLESQEEFFDTLSSFQFEDLIIGRQLIAEEFVSGREYHVDSFWLDGEPVYMSVGAYQQNRFASITNRAVENGPADGSLLLPESEHAGFYRRVEEMHRRANEVLGVRTSITHLEMFEDDEGELWFSEVGGRMMGGWGALMLTHRYGRDIWDVIAGGLVGAAPKLEPSGPAYIGIAHLTPATPGIITHMPSDGEISKVEGVLGWHRVKEIGQHFSLAHAADWCLVVVVGAETEAEYRSLAAHVARQLTVQTDSELPALEHTSSKQ